MSANGERDQAAANAGAEYKVIGTRPVRQDAYDKVTGVAVFATDVRVPGQVPGKVLRSPHAHARIRSIDTSRAEALPGVLAVVTAKDLWSAGGRVEEPDRVPLGAKHARDRLLASDKALYKGHPIAAVAAVDQYVAEEALELIDVDYEVLPPVLDVLEAMKDSSPLLHENLMTQSLGKPTGKPSNVATHSRMVKGDPERGFAEAAVIVERELRTSTVHQGYLEPHVCVASWPAGGPLTVWTTTQNHFGVRAELAQTLRFPLSRIKVVPTEVGGAFGGKQRNYLEPLAALLSLKAGRPVKLAMTRAEVFEASGPGPGSYMKVKVGATRDGRLVALAIELVFECGAFPGSSAGGAARCMTAAYDFPNGQIDAYDVVVNKPQSGAYRAPSSTQGAFAFETVLDEVAEKLGLDPLEFRLKNAAREGTKRIDGVVYPRIGFVETMQAARAHPHYSAPLGEPDATREGARALRRGRGVACGFWPTNTGAASCSISVNADGTVNLVTGSADLHGTRTATAMQAAEALGLPLESVHPVVGDTDTTGLTASSAGSRVTFAAGVAAVEAAREVIRQMTERAAALLEVDPSTVSYADGVFTASGEAAKTVTFREVAARAGVAMRPQGAAGAISGGPVLASANVRPPGPGAVLGAHIVDVEVDTETGQVRVLRYTAVQDAGRAIHPGLVEGQMHGGVAQGIGWALFEGYRFDEHGRMANRTFLDYKIPTALDLPPIETVIVEVPNPGHPYGVRGQGEIPLVPVLAAVANAIHDALGVRMTELPMSPDRILQRLGVIE